MESMDEGYFETLCNLVGALDEDPGYLLLCRDLYFTPFYWTIPEDENRAADGIDLREEFGYFEDFAEPCSVLEVLIAIARRMDFEMADPVCGGSITKACFWSLIGNLGLDICTDDNYDECHLWDSEYVASRLDRWMSRSFEPDGTGGIFPLEYTTVDQRTVEIWYQMFAYLREKAVYDDALELEKV